MGTEGGGANGAQETEAMESAGQSRRAVLCLEKGKVCAGLSVFCCDEGNGRSEGIAAGGVFTFLVCLSTLFTYQHVIADVISGVLLAELCFRLSRRRGWGSRLRRWTTALDRRLFG